MICCAHPGTQDLSAHTSTYVFSSLIFSPHLQLKIEHSPTILGSATPSDIDAGCTLDLPGVRLGVTLWVQTSIDLASVRAWTD